MTSHTNALPRPVRNKPAQEYARVLAHPPTDQCITWGRAKDQKGYAIRYSKKHGTQLVHRQVAMDLLGDPPADKPLALHRCGNGHLGCVNIAHLKWGNHKENEADKIQHCTSNRGERHGKSKLTEAQVIYIYLSRDKQRVMARKFGLSPRTIRKIRYGEQWRWLTEQYDAVRPC